MPACVPINNNNVGDTGMVGPPNQQSDSKFSKIISCLFLKKKTDVVDMTKNDAPTKKKKMAVDRSERSRRVLKMESMRAVPQSRDEPEANKPPSPAQNQMFLPSENPTASFLSYLDPSARRACADVIRTQSSASHTRPVREAFTDNKVHTRNTNYRGKQASENGHPRRAKRQSSTENSSLGNESDTPPALPPRVNRSQSNVQRAPVVVPGIMASSDDDMGYNSDGDISDLHDEIRRMNLNSRENGHVAQRPREGSISLSEGEGSEPEDEEIIAVSERPNNPSPGGAVDTTQGTSQAGTSQNQNGGNAPKKTMEAVIDDLFQQTQNNIDTIYRNGLETMDLDDPRPETATPETCMKRLEADLAISQPDEESKAEGSEASAENSKVNRSESRKSTNNQHQHTHSYHQNSEEIPNLDNLLTEVSIWAKDRQNWLLDCGGKDPTNDDMSRESTAVSTTTDGRLIQQVNDSNKDKCNEWVKENDKSLNNSQTESKSNGILTGPKLFRSTLKERRVSFDNDKSNNNGTSNRENSKQISETRKVKLPTKKHFGGVQITDFGNDNENDLKEIPGLDVLGPYPEPWSADMYASSTPLGDRHDRSTINDDISEPEERRKLRDRSPESWLSSNGSCSNLLSKSGTEHKDDDSFEFSTTPMTTPRSRVETGPLRVSASNSGKSHQILRAKPKVHTPFRSVSDRQATPRHGDAVPIPTKPMLRNTQLKPLTVLRSVKPKNSIDSYPTLPGMKNFLYDESNQGFRNMHHEELAAANQSQRPFSEIPLRPDLRNNDRNSNILAHSSSLREDLEQYTVPDHVTRPVSETLPTKRSDKIGVGPIMATKSKQTYARDVINNMERQRFKNNQEAFRDANTTDSVDNQTIESSNGNKKEEDNGKKRHKVFTNSLIRGGYSYDKHSRQSTAADKQNEMPSPNTNPQNNPVMASVNDLSFSIRDSTEQTSWRSIKPTPSPRTMLTNPDSSTAIPDSSSEHSANNVTVKRGNLSKSFNIQAPSNTDLKRGSNVSTSFHNKYSLVQNHGLGGGSQSMDATTTPPNAEKTAYKFRQLRSRRDQEMEWLMKDAAETEV